MKMFRLTLRFAGGILLPLALAFLVNGCATMDARDAARGGDELPWNAPADWEAGSFGVPY